MISSHLPTEPPVMPRASSCEHHLPGSSQHYCTCKSRTTAYSGLRMDHTHSKKCRIVPKPSGSPDHPPHPGRRPTIPCAAPGGSLRMRPCPTATLRT